MSTIAAIPVGSSEYGSQPRPQLVPREFAGTRTSGSKACLRDGAMGLSAGPGIGTLRMSPNCAAWEVWTIEAG